MAFTVEIEYDDDTKEYMVYRLTHLRDWLNKTYGTYPRRKGIPVSPVLPWLIRMAMEDATKIIKRMEIMEKFQ